jgi:hypothetical protein
MVNRGDARFAPIFESRQVAFSGNHGGRLDTPPAVKDRLSERLFSQPDRMNRIFLTLAVLANLGLAAAAWYGFEIGNRLVPATAVSELQQRPATDLTAMSNARHAVSMHLLIALAASLVVLMLHSIVLTYFMGTGRWLEETIKAYVLDERFRSGNIRLKYRVIPGMVACMALVIITGAVGALNDPSVIDQASWNSTLHFLLAIGTVGLNLAISVVEYFAIRENGQLVADVVVEVKRIRRERGLET